MTCEVGAGHHVSCVSLLPVLCCFVRNWTDLILVLVSIIELAFVAFGDSGGGVGDVRGTELVNPRMDDDGVRGRVALFWFDGAYGLNKSGKCKTDL